MKIRVLDALSIVVMIEQCDPDLTVVTVWHTRYYGAAANIRINGEESFHAAPVKATMCLRCLLNLVGRHRSSDGRADLLAAVKAGSVQVVDIAERDDITPCGKCNTISTRGRP